MVDMWRCSCCGDGITNYDELENEVYADTHFDIERSNKKLSIENDEIEENLQKRNVKMKRTICENCFNRIIQESPTLRRTFEFKSEGKVQILY